MSRYPNKTFAVSRYRSETRVHEIDAEVFGSGFMYVKEYVEDRDTKKTQHRMILIDPSEIDVMIAALQEAKRRRDGSARRLRRKIARELAKKGTLARKERHVTSSG